MDVDLKKSIAALSSIIWSGLLTAMKLVVGLMTGSLGILSEALHSALDLVAAGGTFFAVKVAAQPADDEHPYGHGRVENLMALALPVFRIERLEGVICILSASSPREILRLAIITSKFTIIGMMSTF